VVSAAENLVILLNTKYYIQIDYQPSDHPEDRRGYLFKKNNVAFIVRFISIE
jgi:hypothetical protein